MLASEVYTGEVLNETIHGPSESEDADTAAFTIWLHKFGCAKFAVPVYLSVLYVPFEFRVFGRVVDISRSISGCFCQKPALLVQVLTVTSTRQT